MSEANIVPDEELDKILARSSEMRDTLMTLAQRGAGEAQRMAQAEAFTTGAYMRGIIAAVVGLPNGSMAGQIQATNWKSKFVEFGTRTTPVKAIIRRAGETLGSVSGGST